MEGLFLRFDHLSEEIFKLINNESLVKCRETAPAWNRYLENQKFLQIRIIRTMILPFHDTGYSWERFFRKASTQTVFELHQAIDKFYQKNSNLTYNEGMTPCHVAASTGNLSLFKRIDAWTKIKNQKDSEGFTPLHVAAQHNSFEILNYIMDQIEDKCPLDNDGWTLLHYAAKRGHFEIFVHLMDKFEDINISALDGFTPLHGAAMNGHLKVIEMLGNRKI